MAYQGAYTMRMVGSSTESISSTRGEEASTEEMEGILSVDKEAGKLVMVSTGVGVGDGVSISNENTQKLFKEGDQYYTYMQRKMQAQEEGSEEQVMERYAEVSAFGLWRLFDEYDLAGSGYFNVEEFGIVDGITIAEYNTAYATVAADSKAAIMAAANDEYSYWYGLTDANISSVITCTQVDGGYVATMTRTETIVKNGYSTSDVQEAIITAKDGKIISVDISSTYMETYYKLYAGEDDEEGEEVSSDTEGAIMVTESDTYEEMITMEYAFSDTTYNGVTVSLPTDSTQIEPADDYYSKTVNIYMNGVDCGEEYIYGYTIAEALDDIY